MMALLPTLSPAELAGFKFWIDLEYDPYVADEDENKRAAAIIKALLDHIVATDPTFAKGPVQCTCEGAIPHWGPGPPFFAETHAPECALRQSGPLKAHDDGDSTQ
jgi:hypothetical protein